MAELNDKIASAERAEDNEIADLEQELAWLETARRLAGLEFGKKQANRFEGEGLPADGPTSLVKKTRNVLRYILMHKSVQDLMSVVHSGNNLNAFCYAYEGPHTFEDFAQPGMAIIRSKLGNRVLRQYCSLKYFSDMDFERKPDGTVEAHPHSLNFPFFQKTSGIAYTMISFLFVTGIKDNAIFGSPLCMILDSRKGIPL
jgi:hypothetical protein